ncbi:MAG: BCD family MFS transporter [Beijerinckiaceae bacterium]
MATRNNTAHDPAMLGWLGVVRLGLVQMALGAIVVLTTSTINRVMVVELALPAMVPGALVGWHYALQMLRPRWGFGTDMGRRSTPWIIGGMAVLGVGGALAAVSVAAMSVNLWLGIAISLVAFTLIGLGVGAAGTSLLVLLARRVPTHRKASAATIVWLMMIAGFAITAITAGKFLDPFSYGRLVAVAASVSLFAFLLALVAIRGVETGVVAVQQSGPKPAFREALAEVWAEPKARLFAIFVFVSMLAYAGQDLILEPFAGAIFSMSPGASTRLAGVQHGGVFLGMVFVAVLCPVLSRSRASQPFASPVFWTIAGCLASAAAVGALAIGGASGPGWPIRENVFLLGVANGIYAGAAIGSMMTLATSGGKGREGTRMGVWGAAQAVAFGIGGFAGTVAADVARLLTGSALTAYASVFIAEAILFLVAAMLALGVSRLETPVARPSDNLLQDDEAFALAAGR